MTALAQLEIYWKLRTLVPPKRWANLDGDVVKSGRVQGLDNPEVCLWNGLGDYFPELQRYKGPRWYIDILEGEVMRNFREKDEAAHLNGDPVHQWDRHASKKHQETGRPKTFKSSFSIVASWVEVIMDKEDAEKAGLIGMEMGTDNEGRKIFAVVGVKASLDSK
jgi:hypothetical protein